VLGKCIGSGKEAEIFEYGDLVVKLYRSTTPKRAAFREASILALVESLGLPVPSVRDVRQFEGRWGLA
jgi:RIO-like serine/threonine protein kinase